VGVEHRHTGGSQSDQSQKWPPIAALARSVRVPPEIHANDAYLALQTVVGTWPLSRPRLDVYLEKALREAKLRSSWLDPDQGYERRLQQFAWSLHEQIAAFVARLAPVGRRIALAQTLLKLTCPGLPDIYQGDELESLSLVDPDNRRRVDWSVRRRALSNPPPKLHAIREALALRRRRPEAFEGSYEPIEAGDAVLAYTRGGEVLVAVALRPEAGFRIPEGWRDVLDSHPGVHLAERISKGPTCW
jgi:(1->4)-alpha-D-glucan 1-alpha-D-glucosylmutase